MSRDNVPPGVPPEALAFLDTMGYWDDDRIAVGDRVPPLTLRRSDGQEVALDALLGGRAVVLIFGSYT